MNEDLKSHFLNLYAMALSDTQIDTVELETLYRIAQEKGVSKGDIDQLILNPDKVKFAIPELLDDKIVYLYDFAKVVLANGVVDPHERKTLEHFCHRFGFELENVATIAELLISFAQDDVAPAKLLSLIKENSN